MSSHWQSFFFSVSLTKTALAKLGKKTERRKMRNEAQQKRRKNTEGEKQRKLSKRTESGKQRNKELKVKTQTD